MPKLRSVDVKYVNGLQVDKENDDVIYNKDKTKKTVLSFTLRTAFFITIFTANFAIKNR